MLAGCGRFGFADNPDATTDGITDTALDAVGPPSVQTVTPPTFSTSSVAFVDIPGATINIPAAPGIRFLILTSAQLGATLAAEPAVEARYLIDGIERGMGGTEVSAPSRPGPWQHAEVLDGDDAPHTLSYQLRDAFAGTSTITNLTAIVIPLPAEAVSYARLDPPQEVTSPTEIPLVPLALGPLSGDYTFFLVVNSSEGIVGSDSYVQWRGPSDEVWLSDMQNPRDAWQSYFVIQRATVDLSDAVVTLYSHYGGSGPTQVRNVRAIAVRNDAFVSAAFDRHDVFDGAYALATPLFGAQLALVPDPVPASSYVVVSSVRLDEDCTSAAPDAERAIHVEVDQQMTVLVHTTDSCAYQPTYGMVQLLPAQPAQVKVGYSTLNGSPVDYRGSQVLVLGLR